MEPIFHIADEAEWYQAAAMGVYTRSTLNTSIEEEGFMHCSFEHQLAGVVERYYNDITTPLLLITIDPALVGPPIQIDNGFPHIYGPLNVDAVVAVRPFNA